MDSRHLAVFIMHNIRNIEKETSSFDEISVTGCKGWCYLGNFQYNQWGVPLSGDQ